MILVPTWQYMHAIRVQNGIRTTTIWNLKSQYDRCSKGAGGNEPAVCAKCIYNHQWFARPNPIRSNRRWRARTQHTCGTRLRTATSRLDPAVRNILVPHNVQRVCCIYLHFFFLILLSAIDYNSSGSSFLASLTSPILHMWPRRLPLAFMRPNDNTNTVTEILAN